MDKFEEASLYLEQTDITFKKMLKHLEFDLTFIYGFNKTECNIEHTRQIKTENNLVQLMVVSYIINTDGSNYSFIVAPFLDNKNITEIEEEVLNEMMDHLDNSSLHRGLALNGAQKRQISVNKLKIFGALYADL